MPGPLSHLDHWPRGQRDHTMCPDCGGRLDSELREDTDACRFVCADRCGWVGPWGEHAWEGQAR